MKIVEVIGLSKSFGSIQALSGVDFDVNAGEVHALLGHNGAGKSTLVKILAGVYPGEADQFLVCGATAMFSHPGAALGAGVRIVAQERSLVATLSAEENVMLGHYPKKFGFVDWKKLSREARSALGLVGIDIHQTRLVSSLSVGEQTGVEIAKALSTNAKLLILDEPTAALSQHESDKVYDIIRGLASSGVGVVLVTHRRADIDAVADRVTVLRDGAVAFSGELATCSRSVLIREMGGNVDPTSEDATSPTGGQESIDGRGALLEVDALSVRGSLSDVTLRVRGGEIVGVFGLVGSGVSALPLGIVGAVQRSHGAVRANGRRITNARSALRAGLGLVPGERAVGVFYDQTLRRNIGVASIGSYRRLGLIRTSVERSHATKWLESLRIRAASAEVLASTLSGGNQQKALLARWLERRSSVLVLSDPTLGVDVAARSAIHETLRNLRSAGHAILLASSDIDEVVSVSDRVTVLARGAVVAELSGSGCTREAITHAAAEA